MTVAVIVAAGKSSRMGASVDKAFLSLGNKPVIAWSLVAFERAPEIDRIVLVVRKEQILAAKAVARMFGISKLQAVVPGGARRQDSVKAGLAACDVDTRFVLVHDAARPCVTSALVSEVAKAAKRFPAVAVGRPAVDTVKVCGKGQTVEKTLDRSRIWTVQTPQAFQVRVLRDAYAALGPKTDVTDDCQAVEMAGGQVKILENPALNIKITAPEDMRVVSALLN